MTILKVKDIVKMDKKSRESKLKDLKMELIKANVTANKTNAKTKEIKKAIARLMTYKKYNMVTKSSEEVKKTK